MLTLKRLKNKKIKSAKLELELDPHNNFRIGYELKWAIEIRDFVSVIILHQIQRMHLTLDSICF